ncbi:T9SS type B sorting domain-containing protein [Tenacibaculum sp. TC6]|uniref:T9SS type B sorting domain-containing protein n=1 Tax=Tenacibaculum sp. TC6 TaxID=3423223 RepID=UPI003D360510
MKKILGLLVFVFTSVSLYAQNDCTSPLVVCGNEGFDNIEVSGPGVQELNNSNSCSSQEHNSLWFDVTIKKSGTLAFRLKPESSDIKEDFDFFVFGPNASCGNLGQSIRCSTTNPVAAGLSHNHTGMATSEADTSEGPGANGNSFVSAIDAKAGERYFIVIDRPIGSSNFTIDWTGTAEFNDAPSVEIPTGTSINLEECDSVSPYDDHTTEFDLTQNNFIIGSQPNVAISYYTNNTDANTGSNPIATPDAYTNTVNQQVIYVRLENQITGCYSVDSFQLIVADGPPTQKASLEECDEDNDGFAQFNLNQLNAKILVSGNPADYTITYHMSHAEAENNTGNLSSTYTNTISDQQELFARVVSKSNSFCVSVVSVELIVKGTPNITGVVELKQCDDDTDAVTFFNLEEVKSKISVNHTHEVITFYESQLEAQNDTNKITNITSYINKTPSNATIWARVTNTNDCYKIAEVNLIVSTTNIPAGFLRIIEACDDLINDNDSDGIATFDLSTVDAEINNMFNASGQQIQISYYENLADALSETNAIVDITKHRNISSPFQQEIYVRVDSNLDNSCLGLGHHITLQVNPVPDFTINAPEFICKDSQAMLEVVSANQQTLEYKWRLNDAVQIIGTTANLTINKEGLYVVEVMNVTTGCKRSEEVLIKLSGSPEVKKEDLIIVDDFNGGNNEYTVSIENKNLGAGVYEFSLENEEGMVTPFQDMPFFDKLEGGKYKLEIRDKNGCVPSAILEFYILQYPKFFTPNNDGKNDLWHIKGIDKSQYKNGDIVVFDRFGKILYKNTVFGIGWDGSYNGIILPSNDYWFSLKLIDLNDKLYTYEGHFSLLRK